MAHGTRRVHWRQVRRWSSRGALIGAVLAVLGTELGFLFSPHIGPEPVWKLLGLVAGLIVGAGFAVPAAALGAIIGAVCGLLRPSEDREPPPAS